MRSSKVGVSLKNEKIQDISLYTGEKTPTVVEWCEAQEVDGQLAVLEDVVAAGRRDRRSVRQPITYQNTRCTVNATPLTVPV
jgi:hypothetical protein